MRPYNFFEMIIHGVSLSSALTFSSFLDGTSSTIFDVRQIKIITLNVFTTIDFQKLLTYWTVIISQHIFSKITSSQYFETEQIIAIHGASITMMTMATLLTGSPPSSTRRPLLKSVALPAISLQNFILQDFSPFHIFVLQVSSLF